MDKAIRLDPTLDVRCATVAGYEAHRRRKEISCDFCRVAHNLNAKLWRDANRASTKTATKNWRIKNHEKHKAMKTKWRNENTESYNISIKKSKAKNPYKYKVLSLLRSQKRRAKKRGNVHEPYTETQILAAWGKNCHICQEPIDLEAPRQSVSGTGWERGLHLDHVIPVSRDGPDTIHNVKPSHGLCNLKKGAA